MYIKRNESNNTAEKKYDNEKLLHNTQNQSCATPKHHEVEIHPNTFAA